MDDRQGLALRLKAQIKIDYEEQTPAVTIDDGIHCVGGPMFPEKNSNVMCELFCEKGRPMDEVFAEADEVFYCVQGEVLCYVSQDDTYYRMEEGDAMLMPQGKDHRLFNIGDKKAILTWSCAPHQ